MYYVGFSYEEAKSMPISHRVWFIQRVNQEFEKSREKGENPPSKAAHHNTPDVRALQGMSRANVPANLRRFT